MLKDCKMSLNFAYQRSNKTGKLKQIQMIKEQDKQPFHHLKQQDAQNPPHPPANASL